MTVDGILANIDFRRTAAAKENTEPTSRHGRHFVVYRAYPTKPVHIIFHAVKKIITAGRFPRFVQFLACKNIFTSSMQHVLWNKLD